MLSQKSASPATFAKWAAHLVRGKSERRSPRPMGERLIFVGGAPRSGTTLVQHILDSHPMVFGGPEFDCIPIIVQAWRHAVASLERGRIAVFCTRDQIDVAFATLIQSLLLPAADKHGRRFLSEKTPSNVHAFGDVLTLLPKCRAIHVVRDPRAVVASMMEVKRRCLAKNETVPDFIQSLEVAIRFTTESVQAGFQAERDFPHRVLTLVYESLVSKPEASVTKLCDFLGLPYEPAMLAPDRKEHPGQEALAKLDNGTWVDPALGYRAIEMSRLEVWRQVLSGDEIVRINSAFRANADLRALGYRFEQ